MLISSRYDIASFLKGKVNKAWLYNFMCQTNHCDIILFANNVQINNPSICCSLNHLTFMITYKSQLFWHIMYHIFKKIEIIIFYLKKTECIFWETTKKKDFDTSS